MKSFGPVRALVLVLVPILAWMVPARSKSDPPWTVEAVVENYLNVQGPPAQIGWARVEDAYGAPIDLKPVNPRKPGTYRQMFSATERQRGVLVAGLTDGRSVTLPIWLAASPPGVTPPRAQFTLVIGPDPACDPETRARIRVSPDRFREKIDAYFIARKMVEKTICNGDDNRRRVLRSYLERSCDLARSHPGFRLDPAAVVQLRRQQVAALTDLANRADDRCGFGKTGEI